MKVEISKMEAAIKEKVQKPEQERKELLDHNGRLKKDLAASQQKLEQKNISHTRGVKGLELEHVENFNNLKHENARLTEETDKAKSDIPVVMQYYLFVLRNRVMIAIADQFKYPELPGNSPTDQEAIIKVLPKFIRANCGE